MTREPIGPVAASETAEASSRGGSLARRASGGDRQALEALLHEHAGAVAQLCHHVAGPADGRDAAQQALERIVTQIDRFDPDQGAFRAWALAVARNVCRDRLRRRSLERATFVADGDAGTRQAAAVGTDPERTASARVDTDRLGGALQQLPEGMRSALVLFHVHGASYDEIATSLDVPRGTVMTWLHRGRRRLRAALEGSAREGE